MNGLLLLGCTPIPDRADLLPAAVAISATGQDGHPFSVVVQLDNPEHPPRLLYAAGLRRVDGQDAGPALPAGTVQAQGPGQGFGVQLAGGQVQLNLPLREQPLVLASGVASLHSVEMLPISQATDVALAPYSVVSVVLLAEGDAVADGSFQEWRGAKALPVDSAGYVSSGLDHWDGPRDASLAVVGRIRGDRIVVGVRVRDSDLVLGQDRIELETVHGVVVVPIQESGPCTVLERWSCAFTERVDFGTGLELGADLASVAETGLILRYIDVDADGQTTVLQTAPSIQSLLDVPAAGPPPRIAQDL
ncbi:MAG: hypothetical protein ACI9VR_000773 [Cognaticolwellia sp.]